MNVKILIVVLSFTTLGCAAPRSQSFPVEQFQPPIIADKAPDRPLMGAFSLSNNTKLKGLVDFKPIVPSYNNKGILLASWNPQPVASEHPTFVVIHGGHGLVPANFVTAVWLKKELKANVLVLDSYWSRGIEENWKAHTRYGANMRVLDVIAAGRWLQEQGIDTNRVYLYGDSQGGWTVLRSFTDEEFIRENVSKYYKAGIALYPNCVSDGSSERPKLSPYFGPVIVFTAGNDDATPISQCSISVFKSAASWIHYSDATHGWDSPLTDGECSKAANKYNHFKICRSDQYTFDMRQKIVDFLDKDASSSSKN